MRSERHDRLAIDQEGFERTLAQIGQRGLSRGAVVDFVRRLGHHIGIAGLALGEDDAAELIVDGEVELSLVHLPHLPGLVVAAAIPNLPTERPEYLKTALQANMSLPLTRGGVFAMLPDHDEMMLCWFVAIDDDDVARFDRELAEIVACARFWVAEVEAALEREQDAAAAEAAVPETAVRV